MSSDNIGTCKKCNKTTYWKLNNTSLCPECMEKLVLESKENGYKISESFSNLLKGEFDDSEVDYRQPERRTTKIDVSSERFKEPEVKEVAVEGFTNEDIEYLKSIFILAAPIKIT
jgi:hypothetical protein